MSFGAGEGVDDGGTYVFVVGGRRGETGLFWYRCVAANQGCYLLSLRSMTIRPTSTGARVCVKIDQCRPPSPDASVIIGLEGDVVAARITLRSFSPSSSARVYLHMYGYICIYR